MDKIRFYADREEYAGNTTIVARIYDVDYNQIDTDLSMIEQGSMTAVFHADYTASLTTKGKYIVDIVLTGTNKTIGQGYFYWDGTKEVTEQTLDEQIRNSRDRVLTRIESVKPL